MNKNLKLQIGIISGAILIFAVLVLVCFSNYSIALLSIGFHKSETDIIHMGIDNNDNEYRVVKSYDEEQNIKLAYMTKNILGLWKVEYTKETPEDETGLIVMGWSRVAGLRRFSIDNDDPVEWEVHEVYCGNNATKKIVIPPEELPPNVTVSVQQAGTSYTLHFISFGEVGTLTLDVYQLLKQLDCVQ